MHQKFPQPSKALRVFALILICLVCGVAAMGQESNGSVPVKPDTAALQRPANGHRSAAATPRTPVGDITKGLPATAGGSDNDYKDSLTALATLYQAEVQRLEQKNNQSKELYK